MRLGYTGSSNNRGPTVSGSSSIPQRSINFGFVLMNYTNSKRSAGGKHSPRIFLNLSMPSEWQLNRWKRLIFKSLPAKSLGRRDVYERAHLVQGMGAQ